MAPPPPSMSCRIAALFLKVLTFVCLLVSVILLTTNKIEEDIDFETIFKMRFNDIYGYSISTGNLIISGDGSFTFDFYGDKVTSYQLATGSAAAFAVTKELKRSEPIEGVEDSIDKFLNKGYACASLVLIGFVCTAMLSVFSFNSLPKKCN
ncbi:CASP-like protein 4D1 [Citrus sinensis]|uniref:CASP-like protein n=2 Tax=Citrus TaxID=2706 RepID=V4TCF1_CITCL|nr:hypothetical protein CICLE_v10033896mg [Citrus x clementina]KAH9703066.1 CASP-like protein 4D1 [Citrus sinensis]GAY53881.1 hypothetical protein CUMW_152350 [Citrus unshiu]